MGAYVYKPVTGRTARPVEADKKDEPKAEKTPVEADKKDEPKAEKTPAEMTVKELKAELKKRNVEFDAKLKKPDLLEILQEDIKADVKD